jgi:hypothetical protein
LLHPLIVIASGRICFEANPTSRVGKILRQRAGQSIGPIPVRTFYVVLATALLIGAPVATLGRRELGEAGLWLGLLPIILAVPLALPWLDPPAEHGHSDCSRSSLRRWPGASPG